MDLLISSILNNKNNNCELSYERGITQREFSALNGEVMKIALQ